MRRLSVGFVPVLAAALLALAGCSEPAADPGIATAASGPAPSPTISRDPMREQRVWAQCMRDQGIAMPDPDPVARKITGFEYPAKGTAAADAYARADKACERFNVFSEGYERQPLTEDQRAAWRAWAQCMRDNGFDQQDPDVYGFDAEPATGRPDPATEAARGKAEEACMDKMIAARMAGR